MLWPEVSPTTTNCLPPMEMGSPMSRFGKLASTTTWPADPRPSPFLTCGEPSSPGSTPIMMMSRTFEPVVTVSRSTITGEPSPAVDEGIRLDDVNGPEASEATAHRSAPIEWSVRPVSNEKDAVSAVMIKPIANTRATPIIAMTNRFQRHCRSRSAALNMTSSTEVPASDGQYLLHRRCATERHNDLCRSLVGVRDAQRHVLVGLMVGDRDLQFVHVVNRNSIDGTHEIADSHADRGGRPVGIDLVDGRSTLIIGGDVDPQPRGPRNRLRRCQHRRHVGDADDLDAGRPSAANADQLAVAIHDRGALRCRLRPAVERQVAVGAHRDLGGGRRRTENRDGIAGDGRRADPVRRGDGGSVR